MIVNPKSLASFALRSGVSYIGGRPFADVIRGKLGEIVFLFRPEKFGNIFFQWIRINFDAADYQEKSLTWKGQKFEAIFFRVPQKIEKKFLFNFRQFSKNQNHFINFF